MAKVRFTVEVVTKQAGEDMAASVTVAYQSEGGLTRAEAVTAMFAAADTLRKHGSELALDDAAWKTATTGPN